LKRYSLKL